MPKYLIKRLIEKSGDDMKNETGKREKLIMSAKGQHQADCGRCRCQQFDDFVLFWQ